MIGKYNLCICPSGDKHLWGASGDPYVNCTLPGLNPCSEDPCGDNVVCAIAQGICVCKLGYSGDPYVNCKSCSEDPCGTNAVCESRLLYGSYKCKCPSGYSGDPYVNCVKPCNTKSCGEYWVHISVGLNHLAGSSQELPA